MKISPKQIKKDLESKSIVVYHHGLTKHPDNSEVTVRAAGLFATDKKSLQEEVKSYREHGWSAWIVGTIEGIPAAYLYKELE